MKKQEMCRIFDMSDIEFNEYYLFLEEQIKVFSLKHFPFLNNELPLTSISFYSLYPLLFRKEFNLESNVLKELIVYSHFHFISLFILDKIYDTQTIDNPIDFLVLLEFFAESKRLTYKYLEKQRSPELSSKIKEFFNNTKTDLYYEKYVYKRKTLLTSKELELHCNNKYAYAKIAVLLYNCYSSAVSEEDIHRLLKSHDYFSVGRQLMDDIDDYHTDFESDMYNAYTDLFYKRHSKDSKLTECKQTTDELLTLANQYFLKSQDILPKRGFKKWKNYIMFYQNELAKKLG